MGRSAIWRAAVVTNAGAGEFSGRAELDNYSPVGRESFFQAFEGLDPNVIATWGEVEVKKLLIDKGIIRHRGKIEATLSNAKSW